ncbi:MAG: dihydropteroate synthase [Bacteroidales bacterium]|nr:dihydropteroate synthase [Bacteroidales bacterium]
MRRFNIPQTINVKGKLMDFSTPKIMGILNVTPDSFYAGSRKNTEKEIYTRIEQILKEGADIIDIGGYSSRPGAADINPDEEMFRLSVALKILQKDYPDTIISIDTFRSEIAKACVENYGAAIINDISGGMIDEKMFDTVAELKVPYVLSHIKGTPATMTTQCQYDDLLKELILYFSEKINQLYRLGVNDILLDPGFGFAKNLDQNYRLMKNLNNLSLLELPILVGISRKRMIYQLLEISPEESLNGSTVLHTYALIQGASILRVHDVKEAAEAIKIIQKLKSQS